jgi:hypothetical protein
MTAHFHAALRVLEEEYGDAILSALPSRLVRAAAEAEMGVDDLDLVLAEGHGGPERAARLAARRPRQPTPSRRISA